MDKPVIIITGASRGLGSATAVWLAQKDVRLVLNARSQEPLEAVAAKVRALGSEALVVAANIGRKDECARLIDETVAKFGRIDALVNNAAMITPIGNYTDVDLDEWKEAVDVNLLAPLYLARLAAKQLKEARGRVINVSTGAAVHPLAAWSAYCATKAGLHHLTRTMAVEEPAITAISLRPGVIDTEMQVQIRRDGPAHMPPDMTQYFQSLKDTKALEPPEVPAKSLAWLALQAPPEWTGEMIEYTDPRVVKASQHTFLG